MSPTINLEIVRRLNRKRERQTSKSKPKTMNSSRKTLSTQLSYL